MKIVAVADLHNDNPQLPEGDLLLIAGDLTERGSLDELGGMCSWLKTLPHKHKVVIAGNHDWCLYHEDRRQRAEAMLASVPGLTYLRDEAVTIEGLRIFGSPWQPWFHSWAFNLERGGPLRAVWERIPADLDILLVHGPPRGYGDLTSSGQSAGCDDLLVAIDEKRPRYTFFGHIHEGAGKYERDGLQIINCSVGELYGRFQDDMPGRPVVIDIEPRVR